MILEGFFVAYNVKAYKANKNAIELSGILNTSGSAFSAIIHKLTPDIKSKKEIFNKIVKIKVNIFPP